MTQTPSRDWQKDMEMCEAQEGDQWYNNGNRLEEYDRLTEEGCRPIAEFEREEEAVFAAECREALPYWLQEAKKWRERYEQRPTFELLEAAQSLYEHHNARADAAEAREQQLIDLLYDTVGSLAISVGTDNEHVQRISAALRTLYPDTPAPTPPEEQEAKTNSRKPFFTGYKPQFIGPHKETSAERSLRLDIDRMVREHEDAMKNPKGTPAPKEGTEHKCPGCGSHMVPQWGGDEGPESHWEECQNPDCDYEEGDNQ